MSKEHVKAKAKRCPETGAWLALVLIGERRLCFGDFPTKRQARDTAKRHAASLSTMQH